MIKFFNGQMDLLLAKMKMAEERLIQSNL